MEDTDDVAGAEPMPACCNPSRAKDMLGIAAIFVRDALEHDHDVLYETYGIRPDEAAQSLRYAELAELRAWGVDEMVEAPVRAQASSENALRRRILMAMKAEGLPDYVHPGDAVILMERSGLMLSGELRDAVVCMSTRSYGDDQADFALVDENRLRRLLGRPTITEEEYNGGSAEAAERSVLSELRATAPAFKRTLHVTTTRVRVLTAEIEYAIERADSDENRPVWTELSKLAEIKHGAMIGYVAEGIQYRGDTHRATGEPDILTFKQLCDRLRNRRNKRDRAV
ncbi:hypothetical protein SAMN05428959_1089 [Duganella sp. CF517]|uniref:hypothetical protein n=1 Tax=Duganella sp. CF517 TaxID=1881038 RepID=UPI0008C9B579|nr:hypothetical protein [Duganella sp. CF517]SEO43637.1 hypothetical protein SAMN05428959_1089 [Duganella sp. CF517]